MRNPIEGRFAAIIVGPGAPGITAAFFLAKEGCQVVFVDKGAVSNGNVLGGRASEWPGWRSPPERGPHTAGNRPVSERHITLVSGRRSVCVSCPDIVRVTSPYYFRADSTRTEDRQVFVVGGTPRGRKLITHVAAHLDVSFQGDCESFQFDGSLAFPLLQHLLFGGGEVRRIICTAPPRIAGVALNGAGCRPFTWDRTDPATQFASFSRPVCDGARDAATAGNLLRRKKTGTLRKARRAGDAEEFKSLVGALSQSIKDSRGCAPSTSIRPDLLIAVGVSRRPCAPNRDDDGCVLSGLQGFGAASEGIETEYGIIGDLFGVFALLISELGGNSRN